MAGRRSLKNTVDLLSIMTNATAADVRQLMQDVKEKVKEQFGVELEPEVKMIGEF